MLQKGVLCNSAVCELLGKDKHKAMAKSTDLNGIHPFIDEHACALICMQTAILVSELIA